MMKRTLHIALALIFSAQFGVTDVSGQMHPESSWQHFFDEAGVKGTFVLTSLETGQTHTSDLFRAETRYLPASTFKIMNTLIALECKSIQSIDEVFRWDGEVRSYEAWNKDLSVREAFRVSAVWVYQEMARRSGRENIEKWLTASGYGNMQTGPEIDRFWLDGDIAVSPVEQILFLKKLWLHQLPFSENTQQQVKELMLTETDGNSRLYAKTGWAARVSNQIGWYVGAVENNGHVFLFALNIDIKEPSDTKYRIEITRKILDSEGIFPFGKD